MKEQTVTIQATAKRFKFFSALGALGFCVFFPMLISAPATGGEWVGLLLSLAVFSYGKMGKWWNHE